MISFRTVPHSGTRFIQSVFNDWGVKYNHKHIDPGTYVDEEPFYKMVITLRDPLLCRMSQMNRDRLPGGYVTHPVWLWRQVIRASKKANVHLVRIDNPRDNELELLASFCGVQDEIPKWRVVGAYEDFYGLKEEYQSGSIPECLAWDANLLNKIGAREFFLAHDYNLPWMW